MGFALLDAAAALASDPEPSRPSLPDLSTEVATITEALRARAEDEIFGSGS